MGRKTLKLLLHELGFHHSWGVWILNGVNAEKNQRVNFDKGYVYPTKKFNFYDHADKIHYKGVDREIVKEKISTFFNIT